MEVSPEERRRIYEEEKARLEAEEEAEKETEAEKRRRSPSRTPLGVILFTIILAVVAVVWCVSSDGKTTTQSRISVGSEARLYVGGEGPILVAVDEEAFDELIDVVVAEDDIGLMNLMLAGKVFTVQKNTKVLVIDTGLFRTKVRILEGENWGMAGWVAYEFVR